MESMHNDNVAFHVMTTTGCLTIALASALAYVLFKSSSNNKKDTTSNHNMNDNDIKLSKSISNDNNMDDNTNIDDDIKLKYPGGNISIYYGTQTGTAESFAKILERDGHNKGFKMRVVDLEDITAFDKLDQRCIFLIATYGEGEPPDNATQFIHMIQQYTKLDLLFERNKNLTDTIKPEPIFNNNNNKLFDYSVFGLGNKQYDNYNAMGKYLNKTFELLGGNPLVTIGLGNDDDDIENDFELWKENILWPKLCKQYLPETMNDNDNDAVIKTIKQKVALPDCRYDIQYDHIDTYKKQNNKYYFDHTSTSQDINNMNYNHIHNSSKHYFTSVDCPITTIRELRNRPTPQQSNSNNDDDVDDPIGSTIHMEIDISNPIGGNISYITADNLGILPINSNDVVESVARSLIFSTAGDSNDRTIDNTIFTLKASQSYPEWHGIPFPMPCTIRECLTRYCDLTGLLKRSDLKMLSYYANDSVDSNFLLRISSKDGLNEYREKIVNSYIGLVDILQLCPSILIPFEHFLSLCSPIQVRYYTISSSSSIYPKSIHITVAITSHSTTTNSSSDTAPNRTNNDLSLTKKPKQKTSFKGLCSNYLTRCRVGYDTIRIFVRPSTFRLPTNISTPILMIGPGTGVAPMRAMIQERKYQYDLQQKQNDAMISPINNILYFGCKKSNEDYIYQNELQTYDNDGILNELHVAFSREDMNKKVYVQHLLKQNSNNIYQLIIDHGCYIYVCGGVKMGQDVYETLKDILLIESSNLSDESAATTTTTTIMNEHTAKEYLNQLSHEHRYVQELWA